MLVASVQPDYRNRPKSVEDALAMAKEAVAAAAPVQSVPAPEVAPVVATPKVEAAAADVAPVVATPQVEAAPTPAAAQAAPLAVSAPPAKSTSSRNVLIFILLVAIGIALLFGCE
jgi:hypothetical protein